MATNFSDIGDWVEGKNNDIKGLALTGANYNDAVDTFVSGIKSSVNNLFAVTGLNKEINIFHYETIRLLKSTIVLSKMYDKTIGFINEKLSNFYISSFDVPSSTLTLKSEFPDLYGGYIDCSLVILGNGDVELVSKDGEPYFGIENGRFKNYGLLCGFLNKPNLNNQQLTT